MALWRSIKTCLKVMTLKVLMRVILESQKGKVQLKFNGAKWEVNDKFDADPTMIEVFICYTSASRAKKTVINFHSGFSLQFTPAKWC
jgi:hypothetical protein